MNWLSTNFEPEFNHAAVYYTFVFFQLTKINQCPVFFTKITVLFFIKIKFTNINVLRLFCFYDGKFQYYTGKETL